MRNRRLPGPGQATFLCALALLLVAGTVGCAASGERGPARNPDLITRAEIEASSTRNAHDLVQQARPRWLSSRGASSLQQSGGDLPVVYIGEQRHGGLETLRGFDTDGIETLRYINAANATTRFGSGHTGGVIQITLRRS
jgi:hypothetical protein